MAAHSSILAWRIPWTKELGGLQSMRLESWTRLFAESLPFAENAPGLFFALHGIRSAD